MTPDELKKRTKQFALRVIEFVEKIAAKRMRGEATSFNFF